MTPTFPLRPGQHLGHYELIRRLGIGAMGEVWLARDTTLGRHAALKVFYNKDPKYFALLEGIVQVHASLDEPHIASIYGFHSANGVHFLAMEFIEGDSLAVRLREGALPVSEALGIARQIALAVEHAHEHGVVHRDLKPHNVMMTPSGQVKVTEFGWAELIGTPSYMAPEQARGELVDRRADIWAFGVVLMEMLTGRRPFGDEDFTRTLYAVSFHDPPWATLPVATPPGIRDLLERCLTRELRERLQSIREAKAMIEEAIALLPTPPPTA